MYVLPMQVQTELRAALVWATRLARVPPAILGQRASRPINRLHATRGPVYTTEYVRTLGRAPSPALVSRAGVANIVRLV